MADQPTMLMSFLPMIIMALVIMAVMIPIARRKGRSLFWLLLIIIPFVGLYVPLWIASLTDKDVLDRLERLEAARV